MTGCTHNLLSLFRNSIRSALVWRFKSRVASDHFFIFLQNWMLTDKIKWPKSVAYDLCSVIINFYCNFCVKGIDEGVHTHSWHEWVHTQYSVLRSPKESSVMSCLWEMWIQRQALCIVREHCHLWTQNQKGTLKFYVFLVTWKCLMSLKFLNFSLLL